MNTPSPLLPQGALTPKAKSSIYFKILMVLAIHVVVIGGLLLQGCKETPKETTPTPPLADQSGLTNYPAPAAPPVDTSLPAPAAQTPNTAAANPMPAATPAPTTQAPATVPMTPANGGISSSPAGPAGTPGSNGGREYVIAQGDRLGTIARKNGISVRALEEANPGVNPRKLQIGQKLQIPAGNMSAGATAAASAAPETAAAEGTVYVVKPGDMLVRIAKTHGTRVKAIMELNDLKTTSIRVGQKLKLPAAKMAGAELSAPVSPATQTASAPPTAAN